MPRDVSLRIFIPIPRERGAIVARINYLTPISVIVPLLLFSHSSSFSRLRFQGIYSFTRSKYSFVKIVHRVPLLFFILFSYMGAEGMKETGNRVNGNAISSMPRRGEREREKGRTVSTRSFTPMIDARWAFLQLADAPLLLDLTSSSFSSSSFLSLLP